MPMEKKPFENSSFVLTKLRFFFYFLVSSLDCLKELKTTLFMRSRPVAPYREHTAACKSDKFKQDKCLITR
jgi:hypothetical protein